MLNEKVISIDFPLMEDAIKSAEEPKVIIMNGETLIAMIAEGNYKLVEHVDQNDEFESYYTFCDVVVSINVDLDFGQVIIK